MKCYGIKLRSDWRIRYVGLTSKTLEQRFAQHLYSARKGTVSALYIWMRKHAADEFDIVELCSANSTQELNEQEIFLIEAYRSIGQADLNLTDGGTGGITPETVEKIKQTFSDPAHREMRSQISSEVWSRPGVKEKARQSRQRSDNKIETRRNRSVAASEWQADPAARERASVVAKRAIERPDVALRRSSAMLAAQNRSDVVHKKSEKMKAIWVEKRKDSKR